MGILKQCVCVVSCIRKNGGYNELLADIKMLLENCTEIYKLGAFVNLFLALVLTSVALVLVSYLGCGNIWYHDEIRRLLDV